MLQLAKTRKERFLDDRRGNVAVIFAFVIIPVLILMGLAIDGWRTLNAGTVTSGAVDAAALATARRMTQEHLSDSELQKTARHFFEANTRGTLPAGTTFRNLKVAADRGQGTVSMTVEASVPTTFGRLAQIDELSFRRSSTVSYKFSDVELGLMLDVTGSMNEDDKLDSLKGAVGVLLDELMLGTPAADGVRIALAPYSAAVNVGDYADVVSNRTSSDGCVVERTGPDRDAEWAPTRTDYFRGIAQADAEIVDDYYNKSEDDSRIGYDFYRCPDAEILPLTNNKTLIERTIDGYNASGRTAGHLGAAWAWYLVSPEWAGIWTGASRPEPYGTKDLIKAVVLMTDGEFNAAYAGSDARPRATNESFRRADTLCEDMKGEGVLVFAIGFDLDDDRAGDMLEDCASWDPDKEDEKLFFDARNETELRKAYREIAIRLTNLRITQ